MGAEAVEKAAAQPGVDLSQVNPFEVQKVAMKEAVHIGKAYVNKNTCLAHKGEASRERHEARILKVYIVHQAKMRCRQNLSASGNSIRKCVICVSQNVR